MIPGMRGTDPRQMKMAMKRLGITTEEIKNVEEVIIRTSDKRYIIAKAEVTMMSVQGQKTFQVIGEPKIVEGGGAGETAQEVEKAGPVIPEEDVELVAAQANVSKEEARKALEECNGEPAEAIIKLMS